MIFFASQYWADSFKLPPDLQVDVTITDPPFNEHVQKNLCSGSLVGTKAVPKYTLPFPPITSYEWVRSLVDSTKRWTLVFCALEDFGRYQMAYPEAYVRGAVWAKKNAMGQLTRDRPATAFEGIAIFHNPNTKKRWNGKGSYGIWSCNGTRGKKDRHPNEKPVDLLLKLVTLFSDRDELVFDPFQGSGAVGEACVRLGRSYCGLDNAREWVHRAHDRLVSAVPCVKSTIKHWDVTDEEALALCKMWGKDADEV